MASNTTTTNPLFGDLSEAQKSDRTWRGDVTLAKKRIMEELNLEDDDDYYLIAPAVRAIKEKAAFAEIMNERVAKKNLSAEMYAEVDALPENERRRLMWVIRCLKAAKGRVNTAEGRLLACLICGTIGYIGITTTESGLERGKHWAGKAEKNVLAAGVPAEVLDAIGSIFGKLPNPSFVGHLTDLTIDTHICWGTNRSVDLFFADPLLIDPTDPIQCKQLLLAFIQELLSSSNWKNAEDVSGFVRKTMMFSVTNKITERFKLFVKTHSRHPSASAYETLLNDKNAWSSHLCQVLYRLLPKIPMGMDGNGNALYFEYIPDGGWTEKTDTLKDGTVKTTLLVKKRTSDGSWMGNFQLKV